MYSGNMLNEIMNMVARAEEHAKELKAEQEKPEPYVFYASRFIYDNATQQHAMVGAA